MKQSTSQFKKDIPYFLLSYSFPLLILFVVSEIRKPLEFSYAMFTRDPSATTGSNPLIGMVSNLGIILWACTASICLFCGFFLRANSDKKEMASFFIFSGIITLILLLDDLFLFHEYIFKTYLGINELVTFIIYGILLISDFVIFRHTIERTNFLILASAVLFFGLSLLFDYFHVDLKGKTHGISLYLLEDGFKFFGISGWFGYFATSCYRALFSNLKK